MMEEEFEDCATAIADQEPEVEEARVGFQYKLNEKTLQLERIKRRLEEATTTLKNLKRFDPQQ